MILELNCKPKKLVIQRHTKSNNWLTELVMTKGQTHHSIDESGKEQEILPNRYFTPLEVHHIFETFRFVSDDFDIESDKELPAIRILNEHGKVIVSSASSKFLRNAGLSGHITVREKNPDSSYTIKTYSSKNKVFEPMREFQKFIGRHGGISHVKRYPMDAEDGWEVVWKVYFKDNTFVTVGTHVNNDYVI